MSSEHPRTIDEWRAYARSLSGEVLREKAIAANTVRFVRQLQEEGYSASDIHTILVVIARRFRETGQISPTGGLYDLDLLGAEDR